MKKIMDWDKNNPLHDDLGDFDIDQRPFRRWRRRTKWIFQEDEAYIKSIIKHARWSNKEDNLALSPHQEAHVIIVKL